MKRRTNEAGLVPVAFMIVGMWVAAVFTGAFTHHIVETKTEQRMAAQCFEQRAADLAISTATVRP